MKVYYNGKVIAKKDQRFKDDFWTEGEKDPRIRKRKKTTKINLSSMSKRFIALILVLGFVGLHTADFNQNSTTTPAEAENVTEGDLEPPSWVQDKYPDGEIREYDSSVENEKPVDLFVKYFGDEANIIRAICTAESGLNPKAIHKNWNGTTDYGLCQINSIHSDKWAGANIFDEETNIRVAKEIRDSWQGFNAWTCYNNGSYKKYL